jgi:hypothetical protein
MQTVLVQEQPMPVYWSKWEPVIKVDPSKVHLLYEPRFITPCVANITERKSFVSIFEFPTRVWIQYKGKVDPVLN